MASYNCVCKKCGHLNRQVDLDETDGWMECDACQTLNYIDPSSRRGFFTAAHSTKQFEMITGSRATDAMVAATI